MLYISTGYSPLSWKNNSCKNTCKENSQSIGKRQTNAISSNTR